MSFTDQQTDALKAPLDRKHVKGRTQAGRTLSYVEGWHAIAEANRIFGFDAWDRETADLRTLGERLVGDKHRVSYMARVRITVRAGGKVIVRDGCGYGSGIDKDLGQAHESALKEAETDAMKRGLMTFGNPFGLALYDKDQSNVVDGASEGQADDADEAASRYIAECNTRIAEWRDAGSLIRWWNSDERKQACKDFGLRPDEIAAMKSRLMARVAQLSPKAEAAE